VLAALRHLLPLFLLLLPAGGLAAAWFLTDDDVDSLSAGGAPIVRALASGPFLGVIRRGHTGHRVVKV